MLAVFGSFQIKGLLYSISLISRAVGMLGKGKESSGAVSLGIEPRCGNNMPSMTGRTRNSMLWGHTYGGFMDIKKRMGEI